MVIVSEDCVVRYTSTLFGFNIFNDRQPYAFGRKFERVLRYELVRISFVRQLPDT
jgi:hypothetical protein